MNQVLDLTSIGINDLNKIDDLDDLIKWEKGCTSCGLAQERYQVVQSSGNRNSPILLVGLNPGFCEDAVGVGFVGRQELQESRCVSCTNYTTCFSWQTGLGAISPLVKKCKGYMKKEGPNHIVPSSVAAGPYTLGGVISAGQLLNDMLVAIGIDRKKLFLTNSALCKANVGEPKAQHLNTCAQIRLRTQELLKPKVIIALGKLAINQYSGKNAALKAIHGIPFTVGEYTVVPTYHPAAILRSMLDMSWLNASARAIAETQVRDQKLALMNDFLVAINLLDPSEIEGLLLPGRKLKVS